MTDYIFFPSPAGQLLLLSDGEALTGLFWNRSPGEDARYAPESPALCQTCRWLEAYFQGTPMQTLPPMKPAGTPFQRQVWQLLLEIPFGQTCTYGELARKMAVQLGKARMSAQAIGGAVGKNPISILIPCHRVIGSTGALTGYAGGLEQKRWLLHHEGWNLKD